MKYRKGCMIILLVIMCCILKDLFFANSFHIVLSLNGFKQPKIICCGIDDNGDEYRVVRDGDPDNRKLGYFIKNDFGIWKAAQLDISDFPEKEVLKLGWMKISELRNYGDKEPIFEFEVHQVYYGWNAVKEIDDLSAYLPSNVIVSISQDGAIYSLHLIYYGEKASTLSEIGIYELLKENAYIQ